MPDLFPSRNRLGARNVRGTARQRVLPFAACVIVLLTGLQSISFAQRPTTPAAKPPQQSTEPAESTEPTPGAQALPLLDDMLQKLPSTAELLQQPPVDWIVLYNNRVIVADPVDPRPDTLAKMKQAIENLTKESRPVSTEDREELARKRESLHYLTIVFPGSGDRKEYRLHMDKVSRVVYHEDLMLLRADALLGEGRLAEAFELLFQLERTLPNWPGLEERRQRLVLAEAQKRLDAKQPEAALVYLQELDSRAPNDPGLSALLGSAYDSLISEGVAADDFRKARHFLNRLSRAKPGHAIAAKWNENLLAMSNQLMDQAREASAAGQHDRAAELVHKATNVWPQTPGLPEAYRRYSGRFQILRVGVLDMPGEATAYFLPTEADARRAALTQVNLFELQSVDKTAHYRSRFFELWEPTDLGRKTVFTLRQSRAYWECPPVVTAAAVVESLAARLDPTSPVYDERFDSFVESLTVQSPFAFQIRFARIPLDIESLLNIPIVRVRPGSYSTTGDAGGVMKNGAGSQRLNIEPASDQSRGPNAAGSRIAANGISAAASNDGAGVELLSPRFKVEQRTPDRMVARRARQEPDDAPQFHVAQVVEQRYRSQPEAIQGLLRGEVSMLPHIPPSDVPRLSADERFFVQKYALPVTHILQFNRKSTVLANREIRRALMYAIDRRKILADTILKNAGAERGRIVTGPFPSENYGYNSLIQPREFDLSLAATLAFAGKKQLNHEIPELKLICVPDPLARQAVEQIISTWQRIGIKVTLVPDSAGPANGSPPDWDILYRTVRMPSPAAEIWPLLALDSRARIESLMHLPDWLRHELFDLENAGDWATANTQLQQIHQHLWAEAQIVPLWELDDYMVIRKNVRGFQPRPVATYQDIESWIVQPWYATDTP